MSTRSFIGMKYPNSTDVTYIYCHSDGYFSRNGVYLELFYKNPDRVKVLLEKGFLSCLGYQLDCPIIFKDSSEASDIHVYSINHTKTDFTLPFTLNNNPISPNHRAKTLSLSDYYAESDIAYAYLFDVEKNAWLVCEKIDGIVKRFPLRKLLTDRVYLGEYMRLRNGKEVSQKEIDNEFESIVKFIKEINLDLSKRSVVTAYNELLQYKVEHSTNKENCRKWNMVEFGLYKDKNGNELYTLYYKLREGELRRKVYGRHSCIGKLLYDFIKKEKLRYWG